MSTEKKQGVLSRLFGKKTAGCCNKDTERGGGREQAPGNGKLDSATFEIVGLACACAGQIIERRVRALRGVKTFNFSPITNRLKVMYDSTAVSIEDIQVEVKRAGATAVATQSR